jgi:hypothetical protein
MMTMIPDFSLLNQGLLKTSKTGKIPVSSPSSWKRMTWRMEPTKRTGRKNSRRMRTKTSGPYGHRPLARIGTIRA